MNQKENLIIISEDIIIYIISVMRNYQLDIELFYSKYVTGNWSQDLYNKKCSKKHFLSRLILNLIFDVRIWKSAVQLIFLTNQIICINSYIIQYNSQNSNSIIYNIHLRVRMSENIILPNVLIIYLSIQWHTAQVYTCNIIANW